MENLNKATGNGKNRGYNTWRGLVVFLARIIFDTTVNLEVNKGLYRLNNILAVAAAESLPRAKDPLYLLIFVPGFVLPSPFPSPPRFLLNPFHIKIN